MAKYSLVAVLGGLLIGLAACSAVPVGSDPSLTDSQRDQVQRETRRPPAELGKSDPTVVVESDMPVPLDQFSSWFTAQGAATYSVFMTGASATPPVRLIAQIHNNAVRSDALIGSWKNVGDRRRVIFADGSSALEEITADQPQQRFQYEVWNLTNDTGRYISCSVSTFRFSANERGTHIRWEYAFHPTGWPDGWLISSFVHEDVRQFMEATLTAMQAQTRADSASR